MTLNSPYRDPLAALGPSIFLHILTNLDVWDLLTVEIVCKGWSSLTKAHEKGIWREQCRHPDVNMDQQVLNKLIASELGVQTLSPTPVTTPSNDARGAERRVVDWRSECKAHVMLGYNWKHGRVRGRWLTPHVNTVWRAKVDQVEGTIITTGRRGGLFVADHLTSEPLFALMDVHPFAHLEFAKGHVIFDGSGVDGGGFFVYRTQEAISSSSHPSCFGSRPAGAQYGDSLLSEPKNMRRHTGPLPRGHLAYYRQIVPPSQCFAFRARVDRANTNQGRAILGLAGREGIYLYDLEDPEKVERIDIPDQQQTDIRYIEFDEEYVFICAESMRIYSRSTRELILSFPQPRSDLLGLERNASSLFMAADLFVHSLSRRSASFGSLEPVAVEVLRYRAYTRDNDERADSFRLSRPFVAVSSEGTFRGCHYANDDLICVRDQGVLVIVRAYREVFQIDNQEGMIKKLKENMICFDFVVDVKLLATHDSRVALMTVMYFNVDNLPKPPFDGHWTGTLPVFSMLNLLNGGCSDSGCLQMDRSNIVVGYSVGAEEVEYGVRDPITRGWVFPHPDAGQGDGACLKVYNFDQ